MDFIEPTPTSRRNLVILIVVMFGVGLVIVTFRDEFLARTLALPPCESVDIFRWIFAAMFFALFSFVLWGGWVARQSLKLDQWPLPGTWVFHRTPIRRGRFVKLRAYALLCLSVAAILVGVRSWYHLEQFVARMKMRHCGNQTTMQPNKSLERTVNRGGRTVRAFAVGARAGAEVRSWPAVQRNR